MKVVAITDKPGSAIDRLARMNERRLPHFQYVVCPLHPKRPDEKEIKALEDALAEASLVDVQYWKSGVAARKLFPQHLSIPWVLTHHNEHNIHDTGKDHWAWKDVSWAAHVCKNGWQRSELKKDGVEATLIKHSIEWGNFSYADKLTEEKVVGYMGQMKKVKGVRQIAQACSELGYKLLLSGSISEKEYWDQMMAEFGDTIITHYPGSLGVPDSDVGRLYHRMRAYCANSDDGTESGTMPILEAMASGIPVVTRRIGLVRDCGEHGKNMWIREGSYQDVEELKSALRMVVENQDIADKMREAAWRTVRQYHPDIQAREYERVFRRTLHPDQRPVSVIVPTSGRNEVLYQNLESMLDQTYKNIEVVIGDDNFGPGSAELLGWLKQNRRRFPFPIKQAWTTKMQEGYGLARARNHALIEATGDIVVFCDDRLKMHPRAVEFFVAALTNFVEAVGGGGRGEKSELKPQKMWVWGSKGGFKTFVENFSATWRRTLIDGGMFNERIDRYGGMTQEVSGRFSAQGFRFEFCPQALAEPIIATHSRSRHRDDIVSSKVKLYKMGFQ